MKVHALVFVLALGALAGCTHDRPDDASSHPDATDRRDRAPHSRKERPANPEDRELREMETMRAQLREHGPATAPSSGEASSLWDASRDLRARWVDVGPIDPRDAEGRSRSGAADRKAVAVGQPTERREFKADPEGFWLCQRSSDKGYRCEITWKPDGGPLLEWVNRFPEKFECATQPECERPFRDSRPQLQAAR